VKPVIFNKITHVNRCDYVDLYGHCSRQFL
jgi:hypothetical protein